MDKHELERMVSKKTAAPNSVQVGVTWIEGKIVFKHEKKWGQFWYGICHYSGGVWAVTPDDYRDPTLITTLNVSPLDDYCDKAHSCLNFNCKLNRFDRMLFINEFKGIGEFSLSMPSGFGRSSEVWFNEGKWKGFWRKLMMRPEGGMLKFDPDRKEIGD